MPYYYAECVFQKIQSVMYSGYTKVFQHYTSGGLFTSYKDVGSRNPKNPRANLFSIFNQLEKYRGKNNKFRFKLCYPEHKLCNEWYQSSNPYLESSIEGFEAIHLEFKTTGVTGRKWAGIGKYAKNMINGAFIDDTPDVKRVSQTAIGANRYSPRKPFIPGPKGSTTKVQLYVMPSSDVEQGR